MHVVAVFGASSVPVSVSRMSADGSHEQEGRLWRLNAGASAAFTIPWVPGGTAESHPSHSVCRLRPGRSRRVEGMVAQGGPSVGSATPL
jgi:hypothetical protein